MFVDGLDDVGVNHRWVIAMICSNGDDYILQIWAGDEFLEHVEYVLELRSDERMNLPVRWDRDVSGLTHVWIADDEHSCVDAYHLDLPGFLCPGDRCSTTALFFAGERSTGIFTIHNLQQKQKKIPDPKTFTLDYTRLQSMQTSYQLTLRN